MIYSARFIIYLIFLLTAFFTGASKWKIFARTDRWLVLLMGITIVQEACAYFFSMRFRSNLITYHVYSPVEFFIICSYFNGTVRLLKRRHAGIIIGVAGIVIAVLNTLLLQPLSSINSYYLLFEGCLIIILCQFSLLQILMNEEANPYRLMSFWITVCFLFYWSITFAGWGLYGILVQRHLTAGPVVDMVLYLSNLIFYIVIACIFFNYSRLIPSGE